MIYRRVCALSLGFRPRANIMKPIGNDFVRRSDDGSAKIGLFVVHSTCNRYIYRSQPSWGKVIFSQASVILSTGGGGACVAGEGMHGRGGMCWGCAWQGCVVGGVHDMHPPRQILWLRHTVNERAVRILLECSSLTSTHPTGMHSVVRAFFGVNLSPENSLPNSK